MQMMTRAVTIQRLPFLPSFCAGNIRPLDTFRVLYSHLVLARTRPARMVTLKPEGTIRWIVPVCENEGTNGLRAGVRNPSRMAISRAASDWGSDCAMMLAI